MEKSNKSITNKFNSELLNRPFSSYNKDNNISNIDQVPMNISQSSFFNQDLNSSRISSITNSVCFTKRDITDFNQSNNMLGISQMTNDFKKRKPFDKLSFKESEKLGDENESIINLDNNNINHNHNNSITINNDPSSHSNSVSQYKNVSVSTNKANEETQFTQKRVQETELLNASHITEKEVSFLKSFNSKVDKSTLDKAKMYNTEYNHSVPFWITFFSELENDNLHSNSSYFKVDDKDKYVENLIKMVKQDAKLYDVMNKHKKVKADVKSNIQNLLITELNPNEESVDKSVKTDKTVEHMNNTHLSNKSEKQESKQDNVIREKLAELLLIYEKLDEKEKKFIKKITSLEEQKLKMLSEGKVSISDFTDRINTNISIIQEKLKNCSKFSFLDTREIHKLIDEIEFKEDDFDSADYSEDFGVLKKESHNRLLEIDRQLNKLNPEKYTTSINTQLKEIQRDFIEGKAKRIKEMDEKYQKEIEKFKSSKDKKTIFHIKEEDNKKIDYKDYLKENQQKKEKDNFIPNLKKEIEALNNKPIDETRRIEIINSLEKYNKENPEEYQKKLDEIKGFYNEEEVFEQLRKCDERQEEEQRLIFNLEKKFKLRDTEMKSFIDEIKEDFRKPYDDLMEVVEKEYNDNKVLMNRCDELEKYLLDAEDEITNLNVKIKNRKEESKLLEQMYKEADLEFEPYEWGEDISDFPQGDEPIKCEMNNDKL